MDLPRIFVIREAEHRIHNPLDDVKLATLGRALRLPPGARILDLACGTGQMLCTWARDHGTIGVGVDISTHFVRRADERAVELGVTDRVSFVHADAAGYVADEPVDVAACVGATWIGSGVAGTIELLRRSLKPGGMMLIGEPFWRLDPPDQTAVEACIGHDGNRDDFRSLPALVDQFGELGCDLVEMVLADQDSWDRYVAAQWLTMRRWLDANPDDELHDELRAELSTAPALHVRYQREYFGWGVFALIDR